MFFKVPIREKVFKIPMRKAGKKIAEYLQVDSPCFWGTNAFTHLKCLVTASGPLQGPKS